MPVMEHNQFINAPIDLCFDLARNVDIHAQMTLKHKERAVGGIIKGLIKEGDTVTWESIHFGFRQRVTRRIIFMEKPHSFVEVMVKGRFKFYIHIHQFREKGGGTIMIDHFQYRSGLVPSGFCLINYF